MDMRSATYLTEMIDVNHPLHKLWSMRRPAGVLFAFHKNISIQSSKLKRVLITAVGSFVRKFALIQSIILVKHE